jgi:hypothetical protein
MAAASQVPGTLHSVDTKYIFVERITKCVLDGGEGKMEEPYHWKRSLLEAAGNWK